MQTNEFSTASRAKWRLTTNDERVVDVDGFRLARRAGMVSRGRWLTVFWLAVALLSIWPPTAVAQEFRIYTRVHKEQSAGRAVGSGREQSVVVARTLTLFHAGKTYDYINSVGEVIIFEPAHERFTILNTSRAMATRVKFSELTDMLGVAREEFRRYLARPQADGGPTPEVAAALRFQLAPEFETEYDESQRVVRLSSPFVRYIVSCSPPKTPEAVETYFRYADWMCRLNYVLHPQSQFPPPRLALNGALRSRDLMPVEVRLTVEGETPARLRAEHQFHWQLDSTDRSLIHHWEMVLKDPATRRVSFSEYQRAMLVNLSNRGE